MEVTAGGAPTSPPLTDAAPTVAFADVVGLLWLSLLRSHGTAQAETAKVMKEEEKEEGGTRAGCVGADHTHNSSGTAKQEATTTTLPSKSEGVAVCTASITGGAVAAGTAAAATMADSTHHTHPSVSSPCQAKAETAPLRFHDWGSVDWVLLAAHVYALTRELRSDRDVRRIIEHELYEVRYHGDRGVMLATIGAAYKALMTEFAIEKAAAERVAAAAGAGAGAGCGHADSTTHAPSSLLTAAAAGTGGHRSTVDSTALVHYPPTQSLPITAGLQGRPSTPVVMGEGAPSASSPSSFPRAGEATGTAGGGASCTTASPLPAPETGTATNITATSSSTGGTLTTTAAGTTTAGGDEASRGGQGVAATRPSPQPAGDRQHPSPPRPASAGATPHAATSAAAGAGGSGGGSGHQALAAAAHQHGHHLHHLPQQQQQQGLSGPLAIHTVTADSSAAAASPSLPLLAPDPLDGPWYTLWCSLPSPAARAQLQQLRYHTPLSLEHFSLLLEQFFLVDGVDDFLSPVHAATIMEFAGVRSGPYHSIVRAPLSLAEVRRYITETHRHYTRAAAAAAAAAAAVGEEGGGRGAATGSGTASSNSSTTTSTSSSRSPLFLPGMNSTRSRPSSATAALSTEFGTLVQWSRSPERRVLTIAELERSVWHIAANCVVFNAPESRYPRTARRFAVACVEILTRYCEKQLAYM